MPELSPEDIQEAWINSHTTTLPHIPGMVSLMQKFESPFIHGYEIKVENPGEMNTYFIQLQIKGNPINLLLGRLSDRLHAAAGLERGSWGSRATRWRRYRA